MFHLTRPSEAALDAFLDRQRTVPFSYNEVGMSLGAPPAGYVVDHNQVKLGEGRSTFDRACASMKSWTMTRIGWVEVWPRDARVEPGATVALLARTHGIWALFSCRIVKVFEISEGEVEEFGFAYGSLQGHLIAGEERFTIRWDLRDDSVWYDLLAFSRPATFVAWIGYPWIRRAQRRFAPESLKAMVRAQENAGV